ncbi:N-formylglutamate amidohydrolase [Niveispirillum sp. BGYR6]|uniref:N-formylglutamate amidohydrolase n=1 Tax=Niveispirillum sp. BGYR6 TaxID=2971249 RepID=UPI0022B94EE2|nr:N-formylglutamate amidohydrolase [Niveispirillum sp. BGYR6]MDG5494618.1 N-formylglutamate amidohydrolase [Niveispirillum sp. BGYR6]
MRSTPPSPSDEHRVADAEGGIFRLHQPVEQLLPVVLASPHSGRDYPPSFIARSRLDPVSLRRSEDGYVDEIFQAAVGLGVPMLAALFPRAFLDPNREAFELDPTMFDGPLPGHINSRSPRVAAGLGTVPRVVANGEEIYAGRLAFAEAQARLDRCYYPYHQALRGLIEATRARFGYCILLDCHSMPSIGLPPELAAVGSLDAVLGDCFGSACAPQVTLSAESNLTAMGYVVGRNAPYAGGYTTRHYGRPADGVHALQIELNRALYMEELSLSRLPYLEVLAGHMRRLVAAVGAVPASVLLARR